MTLSNFDWTDKQTVKWFILVPTGHEGPYSLEALGQRFIQGKISAKTQVWAEGLSGFISVESALVSGSVIERPRAEALPPLPEDDIPPLPPTSSVSAEINILVAEEKVTKKGINKTPLMAALMAAMIFFLGKQWIGSQAEFSIHRLSKMSPQIYHRILKNFTFETWDKDIFFKEYLSTDLTHIWLVTGSFHQCEVEASFHSVPGKLLSMQDDKIAMKSKGKLRGHIVEFSSFEFLAGNKIIPGLYEMDVKASHCAWDGIAAKLANAFSSADETYVARTKVVLFSNGAEQFYLVLDKLLKKKITVAQRKQGAEELFWQDLQQKLQTLLAITLQIEQHFLDFLEKKAPDSQKSLKPMVEAYTRKYGPVLTNFVVANENYFKNLHSTDLKDFSRKKPYEPMVRMTAKNIGLESMKVIENLQGLKKIDDKKLQSLDQDVKDAFRRLKVDLNRKIIQVSGDRSL